MFYRVLSTHDVLYQVFIGAGLEHNTNTLNAELAGLLSCLLRLAKTRQDTETVRPWMDSVRAKLLPFKIMDSFRNNWQIYTLPFKSLESLRFSDVFESSLLFSPRLHLFDHSKNSNIVKYYCNILKRTVFYCNIFKNVIYSCDDKAEFIALITQVFSVTWSVSVANSFAAYFCGNREFHE